jgi:phage terminase large subunit-like protein
MTLKQLISIQRRRIKDKNIGKYQRLSRERFLDDLLHGEKRGITFDIKKAERVVNFIEMMSHIKGELAGQNIKVETWQKYDILFPLFGFMVKVGGHYFRRYKIAYNEIARKNAKSMLASGIANYLAFADKEGGAEVYAVATKRDQAKIVWETSDSMKNKSPLAKYVTTAYSKMTMKITDSSYAPLGADSKTLDGLNVHGAIIDEYHAHPNSDLYDVIRSATGARKQPLLFTITTAGFNRTSPCYRERKYAIDILEGIVKNDSYFVFIATIDEGDDPFDEKVWIKANPNLKKSVSLSDFRDMAREAKDKPSALNNFLTKKLNVWTDSLTRWISTEKWNASFKYEIDEEKLINCECYGGLDLANTTDIAAFVLVFLKDNGEHDVVCRFWIPKDKMLERSRKDKVPYDVWVRQGYITATDGNVIDYDFIEAQIKEDCEKFDVKEIAYDSWNSVGLVTNLEKEGVSQMIKFGQGYKSMSAPTKQVETLVLQEKINHGNNPVLTWMMSNVALLTDPAGNIKADKSKSSEKIDGVISLIMALGIKMISRPEDLSVPNIRSF